MWIEIYQPAKVYPVRVVTPFAGVWIEMPIIWCNCVLERVTPFAGVWIEIILLTGTPPEHLSLPSRECGLKLGSN